MGWRVQWGSLLCLGCFHQSCELLCMNISVTECIRFVYEPGSLVAARCSGCMVSEGESMGVCVALSNVGLEVRIPSVLGADVPDVLPGPVIAVGTVGHGADVAGGVTFSFSNTFSSTKFHFIPDRSLSVCST